MTGSRAMDDFCGSPYWNATLAWHVDTPDLTPCFENTALVWAPCLFLWFFTPLELYYVWASKRKHIPWGWRSVPKMIVTTALVALAAIDLGKAIKDHSDGVNVYGASYFTPSFQIISFLLSAVLLYCNRVKGLRTSGLLSLFWFFLMVFGIPRYRTEIMRQSQIPESERNQLPFIVYMIYLPLVAVMFVLNCIADAEPTESEYSKSSRPCPEHGASFLSRLFFSWFDGLAWKGFRKPLVKEDLFDLYAEESCGVAVPLFDKHWSSAYKRAQQKYQNMKVKTKPKVSVFPALCKSFGPMFVFAAIMELSGNLLNFANPPILRWVIAYSQTDEPVWKGMVYAAAFVIVSMVQNLLLAQYNYRMSRVGLRVHAALTSTVYRKALTISSSAKKESTVGEIVNLMAVDAQRFLELGGYITMIWSAPIQIILALYFLWDTLGVAIVAGLASMLLLIPLNAVVSVKLRNLDVGQLKNKDERVKLMNEILNGMRVLKMYAWEKPFSQKIFEVRQRELNFLKKGAVLQALFSFSFSVAPFLVTVVSFATYVLIDPEKNVLTAEKAFVALSLFNIMQMPLALLPMVVVLTIQAWVSIKRIDKFMNNEDLKPDNVSHDQDEKDPLVVEKGSFAWNTDEPSVLKEIDLRVPAGKLVAVVGVVGSGKSSLLSALLGEMEKLSGRVNSKGSIAYVPQQAWIQNASVRNNILFGKAMENNLYSRVIDACALKPDLEMLNAGDQTEIGEKGINLSGGQKQRVSIARAVYNDADVYLFDDPLSAVDSHVGTHIFNNVMGPQGILSRKTRVLVTHGIAFLKHADVVVVLKDGMVSEKGSYAELLAKKGAFADFLLQHLKESAEEEELEELSELQAELERTVGRAELERQLSHISRRSDGKGSAGGSIRRRDSKRDSQRGSVRRRGSKTSHTSELDKGAKEKLVEEETLETGNVKAKVYLAFMKSIGIGSSISTLVLYGIYEALSVYGSLWLSKWTDDPDTNNPSAPDFISKRNMYLGVYGGIGLGQALFAMLGALVFFIGCIAASRTLHERMFKRVLRCPMSFFDTTPTGRILNRFAKDIDVVDNVLPVTMRGVFIMALATLGVLIIISYSTPIFLAVIIPIGVFYYAVQRFYVATSRQLKRLEAVSRSPIYTHFSETITGAASIRAFGESPRFIDEIYRRLDTNQTIYFPLAVSNRWSGVRLKVVGTLITFFAALFAVLGRGKIAAGIVGVSVSYAMQITGLLSFLVQVATNVENNIVSVERVKEYGETPQEADYEDTPEGTVEESWPSVGKVEFRDYETRYREGLDLVLKGINFQVDGGQKVGIVGRTGAGKSSLTLGLFRIVEAAGGQILIDGVDISRLGLQKLRSRLTIIPQDPVLFCGTLRMNVDPFGQFSDEHIWKAMESAHLKQLVKGFAEGLDHVINEGGENLSVGQRQLVCLARALLRKTKVLVFDEATAAVDLETDDLIQKTIRSDFKDCTILTIAHRLNTIIDSDKVLVLDQGRVKEFEPPQELLQKRDSIFYGLAKDAGLV